MQYAMVDAGGALQGFFDDALHQPVPAGAVQLTPAQYQQWLTAQSGLIWQNGALVAAPAAAASPAQAAAAAVVAAIAAGCPVVSAGTPALSGTYAIDAASTANINAVSTYITVNGKFPAGQTSIPWPDIAGAVHVFPSTAAFQAFASAVADWVMKVSLFQMGQASALPTGSETIP